MSADEMSALRRDLRVRLEDIKEQIAALEHKLNVRSDLYRKFADYMKHKPAEYLYLPKQESHNYPSLVQYSQAELDEMAKFHVAFEFADTLRKALDHRRELENKLREIGGF